MMGLTLEGEQRLEAAGVVEHYLQNEAAWLAAIRDTKKFVAGNFPPGAKIRKDDIAKALVTIVEVSEGYQDFRNEKKLRAKYWNTLFADLVIDRTWEQLEAENEDGENGAEPEGV